MAFVQRFRRPIFIGGTLLLAATLLLGCGINGVPQDTGTTDSETDDAVDTSSYKGADVNSVDLVEIIDPDSQDGCREWHVQLTVDEEDPAQPAGTAWYSQTCISDDDSDVPDLVSTKLTNTQVSDFHAMLDQVQINTWNPWLTANVTQPDDESTVSPYYVVAVMVDNINGLFYDTITVSDTMPPNWDVFVAAVKAATGDTSD